MDPIDVPRVLMALGAAAEASSPAEMADAVLASAVAVVGADSGLVTEIGPGGPTVRTWPFEFLPPHQQKVFEQLNSSDPWPLATHTRLGRGQPLRISDLFSRQEYRALPIYGDLFRYLGFDHQVAFSIALGPERTLCVALNRRGRDFSEDELDSLAALRRPLAAVASRNAVAPTTPPGWSDAEPAAEPGVGPADRLTRREHDVLALVSSGLSNIEIGHRLDISPRTVNKHLEHVYAKTGTRNRTQAAALWLQMDLGGRPEGRYPG